jgi:hypothetical protein
LGFDRFPTFGQIPYFHFIYFWKSSFSKVFVFSSFRWEEYRQTYPLIVSVFEIFVVSIFLLNVVINRIYEHKIQRFKRKYLNSNYKLQTRGN